MKSQKCYRVLYLYDHLKRGELIVVSDLVNRFHVDCRTIHRDLNDIRCYLADNVVMYGYNMQNIIYDRKRGGFVMMQNAHTKMRD